MKDSQLQVFSNPTFGDIKGFIKDGEPWFLAAQVCRALGIKNVSQAVGAIEQKYRDADIDGICSTYIILSDALGRKQRNLVIPEQFVYELIFNSRKKKAVVFRAWVTGEVLPSIRKHGLYRHEGKLIHRSLTDAIKDEVVPNMDTEAGRRFAYSNFQKMINKSLGLPSRNNRDNLPADILQKIAHRESTVTALIDEGKSYHEIKSMLESF